MIVPWSGTGRASAWVTSAGGTRCSSCSAPAVRRASSRRSTIGTGALKIRRVVGAQAREELLGEARLLLGLEPHPALPMVREDFFVEDEYVVAMDWVDGTDLARILAENGTPGLAPSSVVAYLAEVAEALMFLHAHVPSIVHGDVKPANLILTRGGHVKLVDFGLSSTPLMLHRRSGTPGWRQPSSVTTS